MKRTTPRNLIPLCTLLGVMAATLAQGALVTIRYIGSGNYDDVFAVTGVNGWPAGGRASDGLPDTNNLIRINYGNNIVTLTNVAPDVGQFQFGVDESGQLVIESGGSLSVAGTASNKVGNNGAGVVGQLTIKTNGVLNSNWVLYVGGGANGITTIDGGVLNLSNHLWVGDVTGVTGTINVTNGGTLNMLGVAGNGMLGLGSHNGTSASGGVGIIKVSNGSVLNLYNIDPNGGSIQPGSVLDISGSGMVTFPGDKTSTLTNKYTIPGKIIAFGGTGTVAVDYNTSNPGKTTLKAVGGYVPPTDVVWDPTNNPAGHGFWNENENWTGLLRPVGITAVIFNKVGATPCTVSNAVLANYINMGTNGPGGTLIITNGGTLTCGADNPSIIGYDSNALMVVDNGGVATFGTQLRIGLNPGSDGTLLMNGGTVSVAGMFDMGSQGGKATAQIKGGTLNLAQWDYFYSLQGAAVLDISQTGKVVINGNQTNSVNYYISLNQITNSDGTGLLVDYNVINLGKTTVYPAGLYLAPAQAIWSNTNSPDAYGLWNLSSNWDVGMCPGDATIVTFNVSNAIPCVVANAVMARYVAMGMSGPGGTLIITNGGSLTTGGDNWTAVGYNSNALMIVENGASVNLGYHLWVGLDPGSDGTFIMNGGTVSVAGMFGLGWQGGKGTAQINAGTLNLAQWSTSPGSIQGASVLNLTGTGTVVITGNYAASVSNYVSSGKIIANGGAGKLAYSFDSVANKTTLQVAPPQQSVTSITVIGGIPTLTYQTTAGHLYHIESTPTLSPAAWTRVAGSTTNATGPAVTFGLPTGGAQMFYRTVSP